MSHWFSLTVALFGIIGSSVIITLACEPFEEASQFIGRTMPPGVRGASINAVASSFPELVTTAFFLLVFHDEGGYSAGIATCAGSAVFNAVLIPAAAMLALSWVGLRADGGRDHLTSIELRRPPIVRDGLFLLAAEAALFVFLETNDMYWWMGGLLVAMYVVYATYLAVEFRSGHEEVDDAEFDRGVDGSETGRLRALVTFQFRRAFFGRQPLTDGRAWIILLFSAAFIGGACYVLTEAVMHLAHESGIPPYFAAVILAAAATSVPDTVLSVHDALDGEFDDAISNALGSNVFDITVALGLPLFLYGWTAGGGAGLEVTSQLGSVAAVRELQFALIGVTLFVLGLFLKGGRFGTTKAYGFVAVYALWTAYVVGRALGWPLLERLLGPPGI